MNIKKKDFFETPAGQPGTERRTDRELRLHPIKKPAPFHEIKKDKIRFIDNELKELIEATEEACRQQRQPQLAAQVEQVKKYVQSVRFTVTVVGEFSRGKSTLINKLLGEEVMPVGNLPTTAMLTKITYNENPMLVHINETGKKTRLPIQPDSWEGLTADMNGNDAKGVIYAGVPNRWLLEHDMEFIDTPGAGDLQDKRMEYVDQAIMTSDCAIVTVSAANGLSLTEKMFLEERIMTRKLPRILLAVTKLDLVSKEQQEDVLNYIKNRLREWNMEVPIFVATEEAFDKPEGVGAGIDAVRTQLEDWVKDDGHLGKKNRAAYASLNEVADLLKQSMETKLSLYELEEDKRRAAAAKQKEQIRNNELRWEDLQTQMLMRCNNNFEWMGGTISEKQEAMIERLQYELAHTGSPKEWWEKDYPYRLKMEMIALGSILENGLQQLYMKDITWLNNILENDYKTNILQQREVMADKELFKRWNASPEAGLPDLKKSRLISRIGTGVATVGGYLIFGAFGLAPLGTAVGLSGGILSEVFLNKNIEAQKKKLSELLRAQVPKVIDQAAEEVEKKLRRAYEAAVEQAKQREEAWIASRYDAIDSALKQADTSSEQSLRDEYDKVMELKSRINQTE